MVCSRCNEVRQPRDYGVDRSRPDGRSAYCLPCNRSTGRARRAEGHDPWDNARYHANPEMFKAHVAVARAVRLGKLIKPDVCPVCSLEGRKVEGHHHLGYAREHWLHVEWCCRSCHTLKHRDAEAVAARPRPRPRFRTRTFAERLRRRLRRAA